MSSQSARRNTDDIRKHWEDSSKDHKLGRHSDPNIEELENWFIVRYGLEDQSPEYLLDVGCGEGGRTKFLSRFAANAVGIDYSEGMIEEARKHEGTGLTFKVADVTKRPQLGFVPDAIVSCRCIINLADEESVMEALNWFLEILPSDGRLILLEGSEQGHANLNDLRHQLGLPEIETIWHNINLDEPRLERWARSRFARLHKTRFGLYYAITRGFLPAAMLPKSPDPSSGINGVACRMQKEAGIGVLEDYGRHYCLALRKL